MPQNSAKKNMKLDFMHLFLKVFFLFVFFIPISCSKSTTPNNPANELFWPIKVFEIPSQKIFPFIDQHPFQMRKMSSTGELKLYDCAAVFNENDKKAVIFLMSDTGFEGMNLPLSVLVRKPGKQDIRKWDCNSPAFHTVPVKEANLDQIISSMVYKTYCDIYKLRKNFAEELFQKTQVQELPLYIAKDGEKVEKTTYKEFADKFKQSYAIAKDNEKSHVGLAIAIEDVITNADPKKSNALTLLLKEALFLDAIMLRHYISTGTKLYFDAAPILINFWATFNKDISSFKPEVQIAIKIIDPEFSII